MLVLVCLAEHAGQVVPKDRLFHAAWPDTAVGDDVLTRAISELRRLFEDDPKQPRVIETIPKSGYRLIAPVESLPPSARWCRPRCRRVALRAPRTCCLDKRAVRARPSGGMAAWSPSELQALPSWRWPAPGCFERLERPPRRRCALSPSPR